MAYIDPVNFLVYTTTKIFMQVQSLPRMIIKEEIGEQVIIPWHFPIKIYIHLNTHFNQILIYVFIWMLVELYSLVECTSHIIPVLFLEKYLLVKIPANSILVVAMKFTPFIF